MRNGRILRLSVSVSGSFDQLIQVIARGKVYRYMLMFRDCAKTCFFGRMNGCRLPLCARSLNSSLVCLVFILCALIKEKYLQYIQIAFVFALNRYPRSKLFLSCQIGCPYPKQVSSLSSLPIHQLLLIRFTDFCLVIRTSSPA
jgi:hypothetical protein